MKKIKEMVLKNLDLSISEMERYEELGYLTVNDGRNGNTVVWYLDESTEACYDTVLKRYLTDEEIEKELI